MINDHLLKIFKGILQEKNTFSIMNPIVAVDVLMWIKLECDILKVVDIVYNKDDTESGSLRFRCHKMCNFMLEKMMQDVCLKGCKKDLAKFYELKTSCIQISNTTKEFKEQQLLNNINALK